MATTSDRSMVLVVDNQPDIRALYAMALSDDGFGCHATGDASVAQRWALQMRFDAVVMDLQLPRVTHGLALAWALAAIADPPPLIAVVTEALDTTMAPLFAGCLLKPFDPDALVSLVRRVCRA